MKTETFSFGGGINNLIAPHLIGEDNSPYVANAQIRTGELISAKKPVEDTDNKPIGEYAHYYISKDQIITSPEDRFYVEWAGFLYWSNSAGTLKRYDGTDIVDLGLQVPPDSTIITLTIDGTGLLKGDYSYCYTCLYNDVFESAPSPIVEIQGVDNQKVKITGLAKPATATPTHFIIYRSGGLNPTFNQVAKVDATAVEYIDNTSDFKISRRELTTGTNDNPPTNIDMLVESKGTLFGAVGNKVHFSKEGQPEFWSDYSYVTFPTNVTGLGVIGDFIIAFTEENMYAISGTNISNITKKKLPYAYGCKHKRSVKNAEGALIWLSKQDEQDVLLRYDGSGVSYLNYTNMYITAATVGSFTYDYFTTETYDDFRFNVLYAYVIGRRYFLFCTGRTVVVDFTNGIKTYYMNETVLGAYEYHNDLVVIKDFYNDVIVKSDLRAYVYLKSNAARRDMSYLTKDYSMGSLTTEKDFRRLHLNAAGKWSIVVTVDNRAVFAFDHSQGQTINLPSGTHGKLISFSIKSKGYAKIKSMSIDYDILRDGYREKIIEAPIDEHCENSIGGENGSAWHLAFPLKANCTLCKKLF